jgi:hypothetical protein
MRDCFKEAPDKSWSVTIANQDMYKSSISTLNKVVEKFGIPVYTVP